MPDEAAIVVGVIHPLFSSGGYGPDREWTFWFWFETWRDIDGVLHTDKLYVQRKMSHNELKGFTNRVHPYDILSARVIFTAPNRADLIELLDQTSDDSALIQRATALQKPQTYEHERFGTLTLDRRLGRYRGTTSWIGKTVRLNLEAEGNAELEAALQKAEELWEHEQEWNQRIQEYAIDKLLPLKNRNWLDDDEVEITSDQFKSRMTLEAINVSPEGDFIFWHDDGDLFASHTIQISGNLTDGPTHADIPG